MSAPLPEGVFYAVDRLYVALAEEFARRIGGRFAVEQAADEARVVRWTVEDAVSAALNAHPAPTSEDA